MAMAPHVEEQLNDPRALAEGRRAATKLNPAHLAKLRTAQKQEAEKADDRWRKNALRWWDLWQNDVRYADKEEWQSQVWVGKPFAAVEQATALIQRSLLDSPDFFGVNGTEDKDKLLATHIWKPLLKMSLDQCGFIPKFADAVKVGFIMGLAGYLKLRWNYSQVPVLAGASVDPNTGAILPSFQQKTKSMLALDYVFPFNVWRDPDTRPRENFDGSYLWHGDWKDRPVIQQMAQRGYWNKEAVARLLSTEKPASSASGTTDSQQQQMERKQQTWVRHEFRKSHPIDEGYLDVLDEHGDVVFPNAMLTIGGDEVLYGPVDNPLWSTDLQTGRRKWPFVAVSPISHPLRFIGRGILEQDEDLSMMWAHTLNLLADGMNWEVNPDYEVYQAGLVDWDDTSRYPGKPWIKNIKEAVLTSSRSGSIDVTKIMAFLNFVDMQRENTNFVNNYVSGLPGYRSDQTKGEVQIRTQQSMGVFDGMARNIEYGGRVLVELDQNFLMQYMGGNDYTDPSITSILGPRIAFMLAQMPLKDRIQSLQGNFDYTFTGVSQALMKADQLNKVMDFAKLAAAGVYAGHTDAKQILRLISELLGINDRIDVFDPPPMMPGPAGPMPAMAGGGGMAAEPGGTAEPVLG